MIRFFLFAMFLVRHTAFGQLPDSVSKISFHYDKGHYTFGSSGQYSISELIEYSKLNKTAFQITNYIQLRRFYDSVTNSFTVDTIQPRFPKSTFPNSKIDKLFTELNISRNNFNADFVKPYLKKPTKKEIVAVADMYDLKWKLEKQYSDREDRKVLFKNIKQYYQLDTFLLMKKPNPEYDLFVTDVWNTLSITFIKGTDTIEYRSQFFELLGQPIRRYDNKNYNKSKKHLNLEINNSIREFVPSNSLISKTVDLNQLKEDYIKWLITTKM
jgi:hypothetical protein